MDLTLHLTEEMEAGLSEVNVCSNSKRRESSVWRISFALVLGIAVSPPGVHAQETSSIQFEGKTIEVTETVVAGHSELKVSYSPFLPEKVWGASRIWSDERPPRWDELPKDIREPTTDFFRAVRGMVDSKKFEMTLRSDSPDGWELLGYMEPSAYLAAFQKVHQFVASHRSTLAPLADDKNPEVLAVLSNPKEATAADDIRRLFAELSISDAKADHRGALLRAYRANKLRSPIQSVHDYEAVIDKPALIVTHASDVFDCSRAAKDGIDALVSQFKKAMLPVVYLLNWDEEVPGDSSYLEDRDPDIAEFSLGGEHSFRVSADRITIVGGNLGECHSSAMVDAVAHHFEVSDHDLSLVVPLKAVSRIGDPENSVDYTMSALEYLKTYGEEEFMRKSGTMLHAYGGIGRSTIDRSKIKFEFYLDGKKLRDEGSGPRIVRVLFESQ